MSQQGSNRPSWLTTGSISLLLSALSSAVTAGAIYGQLKSDLSTASEKNGELKKTNEQLTGYINDWRAENNTLRSQLNATQLRVQTLEHDRCEPLRLKVDSLSTSLDIAAELNASTARLNVLRDLGGEYQESLRACYNAKS
ncbi:hypothetical protein [Pseudomonas sp. MSSRFD41]|uniref:hypothetical protein n=1 Tax=Pseudomonas sp. MSSRFD41 TaxID=1310370 RepID=UPI001C8B8FCA|nr:hypothetical protein [Pseudomonas sp. MSSRFD41]